MRLLTSVTKSWPIYEYGPIVVSGNQNMILDLEVAIQNNPFWEVPTRKLLTSIIDWIEIDESVSVIEELNYKQITQIIRNAQETQVHKVE